MHSFRGPYGNRKNEVSEPDADEVGIYDGEGPPVPIPNTEVKLTSADNTCLETDREDRSMPTRKAHSFGCELFAFQRAPANQAPS